MILTLGNPNLGGTVQVELGADPSVSEIDAASRKAMSLLNRVSEVGREFYLENETDEQRELRLLQEEHQALQKRALVKQNDALRSMLEGGD